MKLIWKDTIQLDKFWLSQIKLTFQIIISISFKIVDMKLKTI